MDMNGKDIISAERVKQVFLILIITALILLIGYNIRTFIPSALGALTLYVITRKYNFYLIEEKKWKSSWSAIVIILATIVVLILPIFFTVEMLISKLGNTEVYMDEFSSFVDKIHGFIQQKLDIDILSNENKDILRKNVGKYSGSALSGTLNTFTVVAAMYFILYFMLDNPRRFEAVLVRMAPLKRKNANLIANKIRRMVIANAIGIPVVAFGQGLVALVGYLIFGAPTPVLLFLLTAIGSMIPIVGAAIVYVPVCLYMLASGDTTNGILLAIYCLVAVGLTDNILRFTVLKKLEDIHPLNTVFGIIMGLNLFGFMGLIFGPILVAVTDLLIQVYRSEFSDEDDDDEVEAEVQPASDSGGAEDNVIKAET